MPRRTSALRRVSATITVLSAMLLLGATPAAAFTSGPHEEIVDDAMSAEGFSPGAISLMQVNNTYTDFYQWVGAEANPYSGHAGIYKRLFVGNIPTESWPIDLVAAATRSHFDNSPEAPMTGRMPTLGTTAGVTAEYERLQRSVWTLAREACAENSPEKLLSVLGTSLHEIQDFYAHTNWVEPASGTGLGADGPGWKKAGFGSYPTWYDIPAGERAKKMIYGDSTPGHTRFHGFWSSDGNGGLRTMMNKDSVGRPFYLEAAITADYASRQWARAVRSWVGDEACWQRAQSFQPGNAEELREEHSKLFDILLYVGRWEGGLGEVWKGPGETGPAGSLLSLRGAIKAYYGADRPLLAGGHFVKPRGKAKPRAYFERMIRRLADPSAVGEVGPVPSSQPIQQNTQVVVLRVNRLKATELGDPGPDDADMFARIGIDGQSYHSDVAHGHDSFSFPKPYAPYTKFKVVPAVPDEGEPVESVQIEVKTADVRWAGTNDDVYLQLGEGLKFRLDKRLYDDFERGDRDTYSVPIDAAVQKGMTVGDITMVQIQKAGDGIGGGWKLEGVKLTVNGRELYSRRADGWLEDKRLTWRGPGFSRRDPHGPAIPVWIELDEDDTFWGKRDDGDIHPDDGRDVFSVGYTPGERVEGTTEGGERLRGRIGNDNEDALITYSLETLRPEVMAFDPTPVYRVQPVGNPDLVITELDSVSVTVKNRGDGPAGAFRIRARSLGSEDTPTFTGLAAGASETRRLRGMGSCEFVQATVDDLSQVQETDETNNDAVSGEVIC